ASAARGTRSVRAHLLRAAARPRAKQHEQGCRARGPRAHASLPQAEAAQYPLLAARGRRRLRRSQRAALSDTHHDNKGALGLVVGAIGVVYGDIGTSPLYMLRTAFTGEHGLAMTAENVYGVLSVVFWALIIVVTLKYITLIMRADNNGEGGILALTALVSRGIAKQERRRWWLVGFGIFGAAMFYGDGMITPAISVLSAVEGLEIAAPGLTHWVVPVTLVII